MSNHIHSIVSVTEGFQLSDISRNSLPIVSKRRQKKKLKAKENGCCNSLSWLAQIYKESRSKTFGKTIIKV